jgi:hypothetical protein
MFVYYAYVLYQVTALHVEMFVTEHIIQKYSRTFVATYSE